VGEKAAKRSKLKAILATAVVLAALAGGILWWGWTDFKHYARQPASLKEVPRVFILRSGLGVKAIARDLHRAGLIQEPFKFQLLARMQKMDRKLQAGEYLLSPHQSPDEILAALADGRVRLHKLTFPEGYTLAQITRLAAASGLAGAAGFAREVNLPRYARQLGLDGNSLEGYLFPDTYLFPRQASAAEMVRTMTARFQEVFSPAWRQRAAELGFTAHEIVTLASIIEKETGQARERPLIAAVFHNRLKKKMRLESDPTVIYGIKNFNGNLTRRDLRTPTPYNTYTIAGLPPGPIASPGRAALKAALYPAEAPYLYFVSKKDGSHQFSTNYKDHLRAVRKYQLGKKKVN